jgi:hypothetical protein
MAGRVLTTLNLVMFTAGFLIQWGIGLLVDLFHFFGNSEKTSMILSFSCLGFLQVATLVWFASRPPLNNG